MMALSPLRFLLDELAPFPGRMNVTLRCLLGAAIVIVASITLQVRDLAISLLVIFLVTQSNVVVTRLTGVLFFVGTTLAVSSTIVLLKFTFDYPLLRIIFASLIFFCCVYAMRVFQFGIIFYLAAIVVIDVQSFVDVTENAEDIVRTTLWIWVALCYPIAIALILNGLLLPMEPREQLRALMKKQVDAVVGRLRAMQKMGLGDVGLSSGRIESAVVALQKLLRFTSMRGQVSAATHARDLATVTAVANLYRATMDARPTFHISNEVFAKLDPLCQACESLGRAIALDRPFTMPDAGSHAKEPDVHGLVPAPWPISAVERTLAMLAAFEVAEKQPLHVSPRESVLATDALTNSIYFQFSLKTLLAVLVCYVFYNSVQWQGVHTIMLTCLVVAQPGLGASGRRSILRFWGAAIGSLLALFEVVFVLPNIDGIAALLVAVMPVLFFGAWISAGSERVSYAGVQIMYTFSLAFLEQFAPTFDLTEVRDRMVGIFLGICVATFIQVSIWPEGEAVMLRRKLSGVLFSIAGLLRGEIPSREAVSASWELLADCEGLMLRVALEPTWREGEEEIIAVNANSVLAAGRQLLLASDAYAALLALHSEALPVEVARDARRFATESSDLLTRYAEGLAAPRAAAMALAHAWPGSGVAESDCHLSAESVAERDLRFEVERVRQALASLPQWIESASPRLLALQTGGSNE
jgi:multidrug resistance protein MdtO